MASEYLNKQYPDVKGFSPRNLRRMRDFYRTYEDYPALLSLAMQLGWIQNVVIMEADLTMELREWYIKAALQFGWSKAELINNFSGNIHETIVLDIDRIESCNESVCWDRRIIKMIIAILQYGFIQQLRQYINSITKDHRRRCCFA